MKITFNDATELTIQSAGIQYHTLKGNGVGTQMYHALMELPTEPPHEGED